MAKSRKEKAPAASPGKTKAGRVSRIKKAKIDETKAAVQPASDSVVPMTAVPESPKETAAKNIPAPLKTKKRWWTQAVIAIILVLVAAEVFVILKNKIARQGKLELVRVIGERGGPPENIGKFWGAGRIRIDDARKRLCLVETCYYKLIYWDIQDGAHLIDVDKEGPHQVDPQGKPVKKKFTPLNGDFDGEGNMYVLDRDHAEVTIFSPDFKIQGAWKTIRADTIAVGPKGKIYILDGGTMEIIQYSTEGKELNRFGKNVLVNPGSMGRMATDESGNLYVVDRGSKKVVVFSSKGRVLRKFSAGFKPFGSPGIDVRDGKIYMFEHNNQRVLVYTTKGKLIWDLPVSYPGVIAVDADGLVYLSGASGIHQYRILKRF